VSWSSLPPEYRALCQSILTPAELEAYKLWEDGLGYGRIAIKLALASTSTARGRVCRAREKLVAYFETETLDTGGDPVRKPSSHDGAASTRAA
jgi:hypothetical protein